MLSFSARTTSLRRGRSACSAPELALPATFRDRKPANAKATSPSAGRKKTTRKNKILTAPLKCKNLEIECFIDDAWHPATIKDGQSNLYLKGFTYTIVYDKDGYHTSLAFSPRFSISAYGRMHVRTIAICMSAT
jgi:hypothetical protein